MGIAGVLYTLAALALAAIEGLFSADRAAGRRGPALANQRP
jgi:hypothetical protein